MQGKVRTSAITLYVSPAVAHNIPVACAYRESSNKDSYAKRGGTSQVIVNEASTILAHEHDANGTAKQCQASRPRNSRKSAAATLGLHRLACSWPRSSLTRFTQVHDHGLRTIK